MKLKSLKIFVVGSVIALISLLTFTSVAKVPFYVSSPAIVSAIPLFLIEEEGLLGENIDFKVYISPNHQRALSLLSKNEIQAVVTGVNVGALAFNRGIGIKLLNVNIWAVDYLLTYGFRAVKWDDLKGKSLSLPLKGGPLDFVVRYILGKTGTGIEEINIVYIPLPQGANYFQAGKIDAIVLPEPLVTVILKKVPQAILSMDIQEEWAKFHGGDKRIPFVGLFVSSKFTEEYPDIVERFAQAYFQKAKWIWENKEDASRLAEKYLNIPAPVFKESLTRTHFECVFSQEAKEIVESYLEEILEMYPELIGGKLPDEEFYY